MMLNLAGFGMAAWGRIFYSSRSPFIYRTPTLPFYDDNLKIIASQIRANCLIAHIRGVPYSETNIVSKQNVHPFLYHGTDVVFAHNGGLAGFEDIRFELIKYMQTRFKNQIKGTTDSEWMYAVFLSQLPNKEVIEIKDVFEAVLILIDILQQIRKKNGIKISSPLNFFISNGRFLAATRFVLDYGHYPDTEYLSPHMVYHSLWYTYGERYGLIEDDYKMKMGKRRKSIIIASEPLTEDTTTWIEVPEYTFIGAHLEQGDIQISSSDIPV